MSKKQNPITLTISDEKSKTDLIQFYLDRIRNRDCENEADRKVLKTLGWRPEETGAPTANGEMEKVPSYKWRFEVSEAIKNNNGRLLSVPDLVNYIEKRDGEMKPKFKSIVINKISAACSQLCTNEKIGRIKVDGIREYFYGALNLFEEDKKTLKTEFKNLIPNAA